MYNIRLGRVSLLLADNATTELDNINIRVYRIRAPLGPLDAIVTSKQ